ncbi:ROK family transcriptional regulator [Sulfitobacter geojensis]|uniref:ROK family transcriptional regulator n=1 Tax=Sulfitobacter geojensis TaxID=1342299 RepID=UPI0007D8D7E3|nr:ROK family protein [Sulfitobacter geojensis]OAN87065.1 XylR family transcriptional regulator [Sulfitobacter geojensis]
MDGEADSTTILVSDGCGPLLVDTLGQLKPLRQRVFEYVRAQSSAARSDISRALEISPGSATTLTADLIRAGLLREMAETERDQTRGRPRVALEIVPDAGFVIGIKLGDGVHTAVLADFSGAMVSNASMNVSRAVRPVTQMLDDVEALMTLLLEKAGRGMEHVRGIGIGMAGLIDHTHGLVRWSPLLEARDQPFGTAAETRFARPVVLENDANMLTLAELWFGSGRAKSDFAVVTIENGVGMGLVLNNELYRGSFGMGLELGHTKVQMEGALCRCGQRGCLEAYISDYALVREGATALNLSLDQNVNARAVLETLFKEASAGNPAAEKIFKRAGRFLALGLSNVVHLFDPALIILSGKRMTYDFMYAGEVLTDVQQLTLSRGQMPCQVEIHPHADLDWARGATARALAQVTDMMFTAEAAG